MDATGRSMTTSGRTIGMLATVLWIGGFLLYFIAGNFSG